MPNYDNIDLSNMIIDGDPYGEFEKGGGGSFDPNSLSTSTNVPVDADEIVTGENETWYRKAFSKVWDYIKSKIQASSNEVAYGTCSTAAATATKAVTLDTAGNWVLKKGCRVCVKFTNTNTFSATAESPCKLNVNNTGAKNIYWGNSGNPTGTNTTAFGRANYINEYVYDGTYWVWCGSSADNNTTYSNMSTSEMITGTATSARTMRADYLKAGLSALCPFKFYSSWTYKVEIVSSTGSGQTTWIYTPQGYIILNTSGSKINLSNVHVSNASKWTYTRDSNNNLKITLNCTDHTPMFIFASDNNIAVTFTDTSTPQSSSVSNSEYDGVDSSKLPLVGGTMTGRIVSAKPNKLIITGTGTAGQDKGSGVSPRYFPAKWTYDTGITAADGDVVFIKLPVAGHDYGVYVSIDNGTTYYPVATNGTGRLGTHFPNGSNILLQFDASATVNSVFALNGGDSRVNVSGGAWRVVNYYDANNSVRQLPTSENKDYRVLFSNNNNDNDETNLTRKDTNFKYNPSTNNLTVESINGGTPYTTNNKPTKSDVGLGNVTNKAQLPLTGGTLTGTVNFNYSGQTNFYTQIKLHDADKTDGNHGLAFRNSAGNIRSIILGNGYDNAPVFLFGCTLQSSYGWLELSAKDANGGVSLRGNTVEAKNYANTANVIMWASAFNTASSRRYKENIKELSEEDANKILDVDIVTFDYKHGVGVAEDDDRFGKIGVIVEDVVDVCPEVASYKEIDGEMLPDGVDYSKFIPRLIKMVQMQQKEIDELKQMINNI